jgi:hypothetical protein
MPRSRNARPAIPTAKTIVKPREIDPAVVAVIRVLFEAANRRRRVLDEGKDIKRLAAEYHASARARAKEMHRDANRELVFAVDAARATGMKLDQITGCIGLSVQTINHLRRTVAEWNRVDDEIASK